LADKEDGKMSVLYIEGRRNGYDPDQCGETMTVSEMIEFLSQFDGDLPIYLNNDSGYTFSNIDEYSFSECEHDDSDADDDCDVPDDEAGFEEE
jgi:hypothetical protein